ncbi:hypothetical protein STENM223S_04725 [Streptomyces tendae]
MVVDILVPVVLVTLQPQGGQLGQDPLGETGLHQQSQSLARVGGQDELVQLVPDPFCRDDVDAPGHVLHGLDDLRSHLEVELRGEACRPHHPERIVREGVLRSPRRAQHAGSEVVEPAVRVDEHLLRECYGHRVHREVTADEILLDGVAVGHLGLARGAVVRLRPIGGHLDLPAVLLPSHRAERDPDLPDRVRPGTHDLQYVLRAGVRREVQVVSEPPEQGVPDRAADQGEREPGLLESAGEIVGGRGDPQRLTHRAVLLLTQDTGAGFVGVRHNRTGYVARAEAGASIDHAPNPPLPLRSLYRRTYREARPGRGSCGVHRGTSPRRASLPCVDAHSDDH